ncbi:MAG: LPS assembly lipoprotein LptE [Planctomycetota bacterium]
MADRWPAVIVLAFAALLGACASDPSEGYAWQSAHDTSVRTISVGVFRNDTFQHGIEANLADALVKELHRSTPWRVSQRAETSLTGEITNAELVRVSTDSESGLVQELAVELTVSFEWRDARTGEVLVERSNYRASDIFTPAQGSRERLAMGQRGAVQRLAKDIVAELRGAW